jgi:hypothetical protein
VVATSQTSSSGSYTNLATTGPTVTVNVSAAGTAVITVTAFEDAAAGGDSCYMSFASTSGPTSVAASDSQAVMETGGGQQASATYVVTGLSAGSYTFTARYRSSGGTCHFSNRGLIVTPY